MQLPDGTELMHDGLPYDAAKAHAYYVNHRTLKGRRPGKGTYTVNEGGGKHVKVSAQQLAEQKAYAAARVAQIQKNISDLGVLLNAKLEAAKQAAAKAAKPPTLAEKAAAARTAAAYRKAHPQEIANKAKQAAAKSPTTSSTSSSPPADTVDSLKKEITSTRNSLKTAIAKQRELATAKKNG